MSIKCFRAVQYAPHLLPELDELSPTFKEVRDAPAAAKNRGHLTLQFAEVIKAAGFAMCGRLGAAPLEHLKGCAMDTLSLAVDADTDQPIMIGAKQTSWVTVSTTVDKTVTRTDQTCSVLKAYDLCTRVWGDIRRAASRESYTMACTTVVPSSGFFDLPPKREVAGGKAAGRRPAGAGKEPTEKTAGKSRYTDRRRPDRSSRDRSASRSSSRGRGRSRSRSRSRDRNRRGGQSRSHHSPRRGSSRGSPSRRDYRRVRFEDAPRGSRHRSPSRRRSPSAPRASRKHHRRSPSPSDSESSSGDRRAASAKRHKVKKEKKEKKAKKEETGAFKQCSKYGGSKHSTMACFRETKGRGKCDREECQFSHQPAVLETAKKAKKAKAVETSSSDDE